MKRQHQRVSVTVPASSANIGPGFDALGLAFQLYNRFTLETTDTLSFIGCADQYQNKDNTVYQAAQFLFKRHANDPAFEQPLTITFDTAIPTGRGLGSSASCIVGGLAGANLMLGSPYSKTELFQMACTLEGHPDNVAAALYGGLTIAVRTEKEDYFCKSIPVANAFDFFLVIPDYEISTKTAREILPKSVSMDQASTNVANSLLLTLGLMEGDAILVELGSIDHLYEKQRKTLIPSFDEIKDLAMRSGAIHCSISGSGPTILLMAPTGQFHPDSFQDTLRLLTPSSLVLEVLPDDTGAISQIL
ncbi:homoserine kinase [Alkalibacter rhizosphaerae]|uniref:Homoserine kinase n=1 Tax=Alkalibacter rhizosphaerae TaxID=2815577 RepID=A0A975AHU2_9FIRM|nr:homoserine kinase [Alkalibacter rhizosphaerae]QSX08974.1 homoserine kinase [Alkalibacter rhizosphaerae]